MLHQLRASNTFLSPQKGGLQFRNGGLSKCEGNMRYRRLPRESSGKQIRIEHECEMEVWTTRWNNLTIPFLDSRSIHTNSIKNGLFPLQNIYLSLNTNSEISMLLSYWIWKHIFRVGQANIVHQSHTDDLDLHTIGDTERSVEFGLLMLNFSYAYVIIYMKPKGFVYSPLPCVFRILKINLNQQMFKPDMFFFYFIEWVCHGVPRYTRNNGNFDDWREWKILCNLLSAG